MGHNQSYKLLYNKGNQKKKRRRRRKERQPTGWEKIFANYVTNKGLMSKIYKQFTHLNNNNNNNNNKTIKKWVENLNRHFSKEDTQMASKHIKRCSDSLIIRKKTNKTTTKHYLTLVRMAITKKSVNN